MKKFTALLLVAAMMLLLCACGLDSDSDNRRKNKGNNTEYTEEAYTQESETEKYFDFSRVQKLGTSERGAHIYYDMDTKLYGVLSADGKVDTGAKYFEVTTHNAGDCYTLRTKAYGDAGDFDSINSVELVDWDANVLTDGYCEYEILTNRFYMAAKVVGINEDGAYDFSYETADGTAYYDAEFFVYDAQEDKIVDGVKAYDKNKIHASGPFIQFEDEEGNKEAINVKGYDVPEDATFISHMSGYHDVQGDVGYYKISSGWSGAVYDSDNNLVYTYSEGEFSPGSYAHGYFWASKQGADIILDENFNPIMPPINNSSSYTWRQMCNNMFLYKDGYEDSTYKLYDFNGNIIYESENELSVNAPTDRLPYMKYYLVTSQENDVLVITRDGKILYEAKGDGTEKGDDACWSAYKMVGEDRYYFCLKDNDFTVKAGQSAWVGPYLIEVEAKDGTKSVVDLVTGETVISGYYDYSSNTVGNDTYIMANYKNGSADIYYAAFAE